MAKITFDLLDGLRLGDAIHKEAELRELTAGDILDATEDSEKIVQTKNGAQVVQSPTLVGAHLMRRQILRIGGINGPLTLAQLRKLSGRDFQLISAMIDGIDDIASKAAERGRSDASQGSDGDGPDDAGEKNRS